MPGYTVEGIPETIDAINTAVDAGTSPEALTEAGAVVAAAAALLGPDRTGALSASYQAVSGDPPGVVSHLVYGPPIEYGSDVRGIVAQRRVHRAYEAHMGAIEYQIGRVIDERGKDVGLG